MSKLTKEQWNVAMGPDATEADGAVHIILSTGAGRDDVDTYVMPQNLELLANAIKEFAKKKIPFRLTVNEYGWLEYHILIKNHGGRNLGGKRILVSQ